MAFTYPCHLRAQRAQGARSLDVPPQDPRTLPKVPRLTLPASKRGLNPRIVPIT
jgi:hypothetical protein